MEKNTNENLPSARRRLFPPGSPLAGDGVRTLADGMRDLFHAGGFHRRLLKQGLPMAMSAVLSSSLQIVDTLMIAQLGDISVAAVGLANRLTYLLSFFISGVTSGAAVYAAQYWGDRNRRALQEDLSLALLLLIPVLLAFSFLAFFLPRNVMGIFSSEEAVVREGAGYLRIIAAAYLFQGLSALMAAFQKATGRPRITMAVSIVAISLNMLLNYLLIFGKAGLPRRGVRGAAIGTLIAAALETLLLLILPNVLKAPVRLTSGWFIKPSKIFACSFVRTSAPLMFNEVGWALGVIVTNWVYASMGTAAAAASSIYETIKAFVVVCCVAVGASGSILIGHDLGAGDLKAARDTARRMFLSGVLAGLALCPVMLALLDPLLSLYGELSPEASYSLRAMLTALALLFFIKMSDYNLINGILRAGGDTRAAAAIDVGCMWLINVPLVFICGYLVKWPLSRVFPLTFIQDMAVVILGWRRCMKGVWLHRL